MIKYSLIYVSDSAEAMAGLIASELRPEAEVFHYKDLDNESIARLWRERAALIYLGACGIAIRQIAPYVQDKQTDPAVICIDHRGKSVIPLLSGHIGGANDLAKRLARIVGGYAVLTTKSDVEDLWPLDTLDRCMGWAMEPIERKEMNRLITLFVSRRPTLLYLGIRDRGTDYLERTAPEHVQIRSGKIDFQQENGYELIIAVTPEKIQLPHGVPAMVLRPKCLHLGFGCRQQANPEGIAPFIVHALSEAGYSPLSVATVNTITLKQDEPLLPTLLKAFPNSHKQIFSAEELEGISVSNPSDKVREVTGVDSVSESCAIAAGKGRLLIPKQKGVLTEGSHFTFALADDLDMRREGHIEIVGAGPGDPDLVSVRGRQFLERADLILYAGSLVPIALTECAKEGCVVRSSANMNLEEQFELMYQHYLRGHLIVRLHTGDPCIYGAIQEQMAYFDRFGLSYHITPGISSFQAAAAALRSQFTIPEEVQTIILTRGEGRTPMPEKEKLHMLAKSQSTMCIFLSAGIVEDVQKELLMAYPPETPVAACYKLTWPDEKIYRGRLDQLAHIVKSNGLTLTTMLVVGKAIDNRAGLSRLYADEFKHLFRK
ncbi:cobalamin biosynthesis protein CbiG [Porphyromonas crevioricanis]|uniref:Cobalamin biosynthesis protein CbiG n=2 Tax=Porphyromonas crevioricanis TaxID=393921 RepID=A0A0A2G3F0_9PORP|nr:precorrin-4 C(11)-methyltransferase [Porphyromonas crevioricanis]KGN90844.1 cobalamin biosynthesis protein CbiG [Porphyromonas crevioricanis]KGN95009.1 cobalamin biosynthesis protein CbiG [Porphyromonas crevioricanis]SJZ52974.1 precorrin-4 C11-methyltransferase [Porphyromonas crevioricanis]SQH73232.1 Cobalt-precorrin-4 C(11)-methyltransferase [Porphyromonas crevioricanis]